MFLIKREIIFESRGMNEQKLNKKILKRSNLVLKTWLMAFALLGCLAGHPSAVFSQCTPTSATICASGDDSTTIYVDGTLIGTFPYAGAPGTSDPGNPTCISVSTALLTGSQVCLAVETQNTAPNVNFSSWDLDITCAGGNHSEITSNDTGNMSLYYTPTGNPSTPPANDGSGNPWYSPNYNPSTNPFTAGAATPVTCDETWASPIYNPVTGAQLNFQANNCQGDSSTSNSTGALFWRECEPIPTPAPTLGPPAFTITKSIVGGPVYLQCARY